ncbi:hypothetical protein JCM24511_00151 [Saitozyma sp. JCM 24511]|nr:hypothetical protein JCM24511_00151 [Saitozyma sp. JCM 24511]
MSSLLEDQLSTVQLLQAMYPLPSELVLSDSTASYISSTSDDPTVPVPKAELEALELTISLRINDDPNTLLDVLILLPLLEGVEGGENGVEAGRARAVVRPRQPGWMTRAGYEALLGCPSLRVMTDEEGSSEYILDQLDAISVAAAEILAERVSGTAEDGGATDQPEGEAADSLERVWFWFPSLSSKEKRRDLVTYAEDSGLTGFVLAGKPGLLCVEGDGREVDRYMSRIKSESWSDIPPHQKKVTERLRRPLPDATHRRFSDMQDITDRIPHYGQYAHRGEMGEVRRLMDEWGVGEDFGAVVMNAGT